MVLRERLARSLGPEKGSEARGFWLAACEFESKPLILKADCLDVKRVIGMRTLRSMRARVEQAFWQGRLLQLQGAQLQSVNVQE